MLSVILGAGFSYVGGVPLASQLFGSVPEVDRITRRQLVARVVRGWQSWHASNGGGPEQYLAVLQEERGVAWYEAVWFVSLSIALKTARLQMVGSRPAITGHQLNKATGIPCHEKFWTTIFRKTDEVAVLTTNYDILIERGIRNQPRPRVPRPGFNYGLGPEILEGRGYPSFAHMRPIAASGSVPLYKLHGSVSWSVENGALMKYYDCRPSIRGDAAIVAPVTEKLVPGFLEPIWRGAAECLSKSDIWIIVGYSLPSYDIAVRNLLSDNAEHGPTVHVFNPSRAVEPEISELLPRATIHMESGLPEGLPRLERIMSSMEDARRASTERY
ncbi:MAG TPA: hypothetical protein VII06_23325 [Chloroflexota bacterium]|jgi:hypothetical protein